MPGAPGSGSVIISTTYSCSESQILLLGPFHGKPACQEIRFGKGVCGTAAAKQETVIVPDVLTFPGHIACDAESRSEIVVPILVNGEVSTHSLTALAHFLEIQLGLEEHTHISTIRLSLSLTSTAPSLLDLMRRTKSTWRNWPPSWLRTATGKSEHNLFFIFYNAYERHGLKMKLFDL